METIQRNTSDTTIVKNSPLRYLLAVYGELAHSLPFLRLSLRSEHKTYPSVPKYTDRFYINIESKKSLYFRT